MTCCGGVRTVNGAFILGICLVVAGSLLFMEKLGLLSFHELKQYWPVALIGLGALLLVEGSERRQ